MVTSNCLLTALLSVATAYRVSNFMATYGRWRLLTRDLGCWLTRTQTNTYLSNSYLSQFVPNANPYPSQPIPNTNSYPNQLVPKSTRTQYQLVPKPTRTQIRRWRRLLSANQVSKEVSNNALIKVTLSRQRHCRGTVQNLKKNKHNDRIADSQ